MATSAKIIDLIKELNVMELAQLIKDLENEFGVSAAAPVAAVAAAPAAAAPVAEEKNEYKVVLKDGGADKIKAIKALRSVVTTLSLGDAKAGVENCPFVISEAAPKDEAQKIKKTMEEAGAKVDLV